MNATNLSIHSAFVLPTDIWLVIPHTHAHGGIQRTRMVIERVGEGVAGERMESKNTQIIADVAERDRAEEIANKAKGLVRKHLQFTDMGYLADATTLTALDAALADVTAAAKAHNATARHSWVRVQILRAPIVKDGLGQNEVLAVASKVREELTAMRDAIRAGDVDTYREARMRSPNLPSLTVGAVKLSVEMGLTEARNAVQLVKDNASDRAKAAKKNQPIPAVINFADLQLGQLETAIELLTES